MSKTAVAQQVEQLNGLLLALTDRTLLVPNTAVAELIPYSPLQAVTEGGPSWLLGHIYWRGLQLPLISFEAIAGSVCQVGATARVVVLNGLTGHAQLKFYALLVQDIPRSVGIDSGLQPDQVATLHRCECEAVRLDGHHVRIPDFDAVEQLLADNRAWQQT